jgi:hypothetical protein
MIRRTLFAGAFAISAAFLGFSQQTAPEDVILRAMHGRSTVHASFV